MPWINDYEFIKKLIGLGININGLDFNTSALNVACETDNVEMIEFYLKMVLNFTIKNTTKESIF